MSTHDSYEKVAIEAIKKDFKNFDENNLKEIAYNAMGFNSLVFIFSYSSDVTYLYIVTVYPNKSADVETYFYEYSYSIVGGKVE